MGRFGMSEQEQKKYSSIESIYCDNFIDSKGTNIRHISVIIALVSERQWEDGSLRYAYACSIGSNCNSHICVYSSKNKPKK